MTFGQRFAHQGRTIFGELDAVGHGMEPLGQLQQSMAFAGTRVQDEAVASGRRQAAEADQARRQRLLGQRHSSHPLFVT